MNQDQWLIERFDRIDKDNAQCLTKLEHVQATVTKHAAYWEITKWLAVSIAGLCVSLLGFLGFRISR
jgi:hypothetical protein